jgi:type IV secretion system protein VirD4
MRLRLTAVLIAAVFVSARPLAAAPMSEAWIDHAPTVAQVFKDVQGTDAIDTPARQAAAFEILRNSIQTWTDALDARRMSPRASAKFTEYSRAFREQPYGLKFDDGACTGEACIRYQYFTKQYRYSTDLRFIRELLARYFSSEYVAAEVAPKTAAQTSSPGKNPLPLLQSRADSGSGGFMAGGIVILLIAAVVGIVFTLRRKRVDPVPPLTENYGSAAWAEHRLQPFSPADIPLGVTFGKSSGPGLPPNAPGAPVTSMAETHTLIVARTRAGKGTRVIVPTLLRYTGSMLVIDPKGENAAITARTRRDQLHHTVHIVNPWGEMEDHYKKLDFAPATFNPLDAIDRNDPNAVAVAQSLAAIICPPASGKEQFWQGSAANVLAAVFLWLADQPGEQKTLARARQIVTLSRADFLKILVKMAISTAYKGAVSEMVSQYVDLAPETYSAIMANLAENTKFLSDPRIKDSTSSSSFSLKTLLDAFTTVYIVIPHDRIQTHATWLRLVIAAAMQGIKSRDKRVRPHHRCMFLIDEFGSIGHIADIPRDIALMSGYGLDFTLIVQGLDQLKDHYGDARGTILSNCAFKWFCFVNEIETAKYLSESLGKATVRTVGKSLSTGQNPGGGTEGQSTTYGEVGRDLLTPDEILNIGREVAILLNPRGLPFYLRPVDYWNLADTFAHLQEKYAQFYWDPPLEYDDNPYFKGPRPQPGNGMMSRREALSVFSLGDHADRDAIATRYQAMMSHLQPGEDDIARKINEAKKVLLDI